MCVMHKWYNIGLHLGIISDNLDRIQETYGRDMEACYTDMIAEWLNNKYVFYLQDRLVI